MKAQESAGDGRWETHQLLLAVAEPLVSRAFTVSYAKRPINSSVSR